MVARAALFFLLAALTACGGQPLEPWHTANLAEEFDARKAETVTSFEDYLALEERLFNELREVVYSQVETGPEFTLVRYSTGSAADPAMRTPDYNRSYELQRDEPVGGVLLLHGMSDSPYSLRQLGETLHEAGYHVVSLRLPGHGTVPAALRRVRWEDMASVVRLGVDHLASAVGDKPLHIVGYSTGSSFALDHALNALDDSTLVNPASLVLISPAIGITRAAALAGPKATLGRAPGFGRLAYTQIEPEFDPFKYNSFATNAGSQVHRITRSVAGRIARLSRDGRGSELPPILVFKSTVDATVSVDAVIDQLLGLLPDNGNELVLYDINRAAVVSLLLVSDPGPFTVRLMRDESLPFAVRLIANASQEGNELVSHYKPALAAGATETTPLDLRWPPGVISLSHIALPFPPDDPLYGQEPPDREDELFLGMAEIRGERGLLRISTSWLLRLRHNPFYSTLEGRVLEWLNETISEVQ